MISDYPFYWAFYTFCCSYKIDASVKKANVADRKQTLLAHISMISGISIFANWAVYTFYHHYNLLFITHLTWKNIWALEQKY